MSQQNYDQINESYFERKHELVVNEQVGASELSGINKEDRSEVLKLALEVYPRILEWVGRHKFGVILPKRIAATCLSSASMFPHSDEIAYHGENEGKGKWIKKTTSSIPINYQAEVVFQDTTVSLMFFAMDDVADGAIGNYSDQETEELLGLYERIVRTEGANYTNLSQQFIEEIKRTGNPLALSGVQVAAVLAECCQELKIFGRRFDNYYPFFVKRFGLLMQSWRQELKWREAYRQSGQYPSFEEYLANGQESVVAPTIAACLLVMTAQLKDNVKGAQVPNHPHSQSQEKEEAAVATVTNAALLTPSLEELLDKVVLTCGASIRLANDLRSFERERVEGKPNSVVILEKSLGLSQAEIERELLAQADQRLEELDRLVGLLPPAFNTWGRAVQRMGHFTRDWYLSREFHDFSLEMMQNLASGSQVSR